jgi:hypothetical protein
VKGKDGAMEAVPPPTPTPPSSSVTSTNKATLVFNAVVEGHELGGVFVDTVLPV